MSDEDYVVNPVLALRLSERTARGLCSLLLPKAQLPCLSCLFVVWDVVKTDR